MTLKLVLWIIASIVDFEIADLSLIDNKISLKIKDSELDLKIIKILKK